MIKAPEIETIQSGSPNRPYETRLYRGVTKNGIVSEYNEVLVLAPGWLGSGTLHFAAMHLAQRGHDVAVVNHDNTSFWHPNKDRSQNVHLTAKAASVKTGKTGVILAGHSLGNRDVHSAATAAIERQVRNPDDKTLYRINAIGAIAGAGLSGKILHGDKLYSEIRFASRELADHPIEELSVVGRSLANLLKKPLVSTAEGFGAIVCDVRGHARDFIVRTAPRSYVESYLNHDGVIPLPVGRAGFDMYEGTHLRPIVDGDILDAISSKLYEPNNPANLELASFALAA